MRETLPETAVNGMGSRGVPGVKPEPANPLLDPLHKLQKAPPSLTNAAVPASQEQTLAGPTPEAQKLQAGTASTEQPQSFRAALLEGIGLTANKTVLPTDPPLASMQGQQDLTRGDAGAAQQGHKPEAQAQNGTASESASQLLGSAAQYQPPGGAMEPPQPHAGVSLNDAGPDSAVAAVKAEGSPEPVQMDAPKGLYQPARERADQTAEVPSSQAGSAVRPKPVSAAAGPVPNAIAMAYEKIKENPLPTQAAGLQRPVQVLGNSPSFGKVQGSAWVFP